MALYHRVIPYPCFNPDHLRHSGGYQSKLMLAAFTGFMHEWIIQYRRNILRGFSYTVQKRTCSSGSACHPVGQDDLKSRKPQCDGPAYSFQRNATGLGWLAPIWKEQYRCDPAFLCHQLLHPEKLIFRLIVKLSCECRWNECLPSSPTEVRRSSSPLLIYSPLTSAHPHR